MFQIGRKKRKQLSKGFPEKYQELRLMEKASNAKDTSMNYKPVVFGEDAYDLISTSKGSL